MNTNDVWERNKLKRFSPQLWKGFTHVRAASMRSISRQKKRGRKWEGNTERLPRSPTCQIDDDSGNSDDGTQADKSGERHRSVARLMTQFGRKSPEDAACFFTLLIESHQTPLADLQAAAPGSCSDHTFKHLHLPFFHFLTLHFSSLHTADVSPAPLFFFCSSPLSFSHTHSSGSRCDDVMEKRRHWTFSSLFFVSSKHSVSRRRRRSKQSYLPQIREGAQRYFFGFVFFSFSSDTQTPPSLWTLTWLGCCLTRRQLGKWVCRSLAFWQLKPLFLFGEKVKSVRRWKRSGRKEGVRPVLWWLLQQLQRK